MLCATYLKVHPSPGGRTKQPLSYPPPPQNLSKNNNLQISTTGWGRWLRRTLLLLTVAGAVLTQPARAQAADVTLLASPISLTERAGSTTVTVTAARVGSNTSGAITVTLTLPASYTPLLTPNTRLATKDTDYTTTFSTNTITIADGFASASVTFDIDPTYDTGSEGDETIIMTGSASGLTVSPTELIITDGPYLSFPKLIYGHLYYPDDAVTITVPAAENTADPSSVVSYALTKTDPSTDPFNLSFATDTRQLTGTAPATAPTNPTARYTITATDNMNTASTSDDITATTIVSVSVIPDVCESTKDTWKGSITAPPAELIKDCNVLMAAKDTLRGTATTLNWATNTDIGTWTGLALHAVSKQIQKIEIHGKSLNGTIPPVLGNLSSPNLTNLNLGDDYRKSSASTQNKLTGPIPPELGNLPTLGVLALSSNQLTGTIPRELTSNSKLLYLYASFTGSSGLSGSIPPEFGKLGMRALNLINNNLSGPVPWQLGQNLELQVLNLANNKLSGTVSWQLGSFGKMQYFSLSGNAMSGPIPWQLGNLGITEERDIAKMRLYLGNMGLTGSIPPQLGNIPRLTTLILSQNQLSGEIPSELGRLAQLQYLYLRDNQLTGSIPAEWGTTGYTLPALLRIVLYNNQLSGSIPTALGSLAKLQWLYLDNNQLSGNIPAALGKLAKLQRLYLNNNQLTGRIPAEWGATDYTLPELLYLVLNNNQLSGSIPTALGSLAKLQWLYLDNNQLSGQVPSALGSLSTLTRFTLNANQLTGQIPSALGSLSTLTDFYFDYNAVSNQTLCLPATLQTWYDGLTDKDAGEVRCAFAYPDSPTLTPGSDRITARWASAPTLTLADSSVNGYEVQAIPTSGGQWQPVPGPTTAEWAATLTGLTPGQRYTVRYRARAPHSAADRFFASPWVQMDPVTLSAGGTGGTGTTSGTGGGGGGATATDQHGDTPATATAVSVGSRQTARRGTRTSGQINSTDDVDYFQLSVPQAGWLVLATTGSTDTQGTLWEAEALLTESSALQTGALHLLTQAASHVVPLAEDDDSGRDRNFRIPLRVPAGDYLLAVAGSGSATGAYTLRATLVVGWLDNPQPASAQSGIGVLSGWLCAADSVVFAVNDTLELEAAYGTERLDTADECEETNTGFGLLYNWNLLGTGEHTVTLVVDGNSLETLPVSVTTLGAEFLTGATRETTVRDFPTDGESVRLVWQEAQQNFALASGAGGGSGTHRDPDRAFLENPRPGSFQSGIGVLSGWACEADTVVLEIDDTLRLAAGYGTERTDTVGKCDDADNGFGVLFNWNLLGDGEHTVRLLIDEEEWATATFTVTTLGEETVRGLARTEPVVDFPGPGETVTVEWQEAQQNFVIVGVGD